MGQKHCCQQAAQSDEERFKLRTMGKGNGPQPPSEEEVDQAGKQMMQGDANKREYVNNKARAKGAHLKCMHINKDGSTGQHYGEKSHTSSRVSVGVSLFFH